MLMIPIIKHNKYGQCLNSCIITLGFISSKKKASNTNIVKEIEIRLEIHRRIHNK